MCEIVKYIKINSIGTLLAHNKTNCRQIWLYWTIPPIFSEAEEETSLSSLEHETGIFRALFYLIIMLREN